MLSVGKSNKERKIQFNITNNVSIFFQIKVISFILHFIIFFFAEIIKETVNKDRDILMPFIFLFFIVECSFYRFNGNAWESFYQLF